MKRNKPRRKHVAPRLGDLVVIHFLDHAEDGSAISFRVAGWLSSITAASYQLISWDYAGDEYDRGEDDTNIKRWAIVRGAIKTLRIIEEGDRPLP